MSKHARAGVAALAAAIALVGSHALRVRGDAASDGVAPDVNAQYQSVLEVMKHPPATGILVTEIGPDSPAGAAGLLAGDIIYHFAGTPVHDLQTLRQQVADLFAAHAAGDSNEKVLLGVHRGSQNLILRVPREPLGIRAIEVDAGAAVSPNPPPSPRGSITLAWQDLIDRQIPTAAGDNSYFRVDEVAAAAPLIPPAQAPETVWLGWQHRAMTVGDGALLGQIETYHIDPDDPSAHITSSESVRFRLRTGDFATAPAFLLEMLDVTLNNGDGTVTTMSAQRAGETLRTQTTVTAPTRIVGPVNRKQECPVSAIVSAAVPLVAAALPHEKNAALALSMLSVRDGVSRPGYLLITRGERPLREEKIAPNAWRVDLLHCGVIAETYWFSDQRRLLEVQTPSGTTLVARRVNSQAEASVPMVAATQNNRQ